MKEYPQPWTVKEAQSFLGVVSWLWRFIPRCATLTVVGEVMKERRRREREVDNLSTCGCMIQLYLWENTQFIEIREFGWGFLMLTS